MIEKGRVGEQILPKNCDTTPGKCKVIQGRFGACVPFSLSIVLLQLINVTASQNIPHLGAGENDRNIPFYKWVYYLNYWLSLFIPIA